MKRSIRRMLGRRRGGAVRKAAAIAIVCALFVLEPAQATAAETGVTAEQAAAIAAAVQASGMTTEQAAGILAAVQMIQMQNAAATVAGADETAASEPAITASSRAIAAYTEDYTMGTVSAQKNGVTFQNSVYAEGGDSIAVSASPNSGYSFAYFTDNGVIVTKSAYYTFSPGYYDHTVVAHFVKRSDDDDDEDDDDEDTPRVNWSNSACVYAPGYRIDAVSVTTNQVVQGKQCREAFDSVLGDYQYIGMYNISFAHAGTPLEKLSGSVRLLFDIPAQYQKTGRSFRMLRVYRGQPAILENLDDRGNKVLFETDCTAAYALVYRD